MAIRNSSDTAYRARGASISFRAAEVIRQAIFDGKLEPGDALPESQLTQDLGISQTSVREALFSLEREGLVVRIPNKGTSIIKLTEEELRERAMVYALLESTAAVEAAGKMSPADQEKLEHSRRETDGIPQSGCPQSFRQTDLEFHRLVWRFAGNAALYSTLDSLALPMFALGRIARPVLSGEAAQTPRGHQAITLAMQSGDNDRIIRTVSEHVTRSFLRAKIAGFEILG
ncbi:MAG: GntR family transcriptional regulator [Acidobacteriota bacterium]